MESIYQKGTRWQERALRGAVWGGAAIVMGMVLCIILCVLIRGVPYLSWELLTGVYSERVDAPCSGILPMLLNTVYLILLTLLIAVPIGIGSAVFLTQYAKQGRLLRMINFSIGVLSGLPSILFGLFGYTVFCTAMGLQTSVLAGCLTMALCVLPILIRTTEEALRSVPQIQMESASALGAQRCTVVRTVLLPEALPGILTAVILAVGKIAGESAALLFTAGMSYRMPRGMFSHLFESGRTLTLHLYQLARESGSEEAMNTAFAVAAILLLFVFFLNCLTRLFQWFWKRRG